MCLEFSTFFAKATRILCSPYSDVANVLDDRGIHYFYVYSRASAWRNWFRTLRRW